MTAVVFGASGQDGHYLSELLRGIGMQAIEISRSAGDHTGSVADPEFVSGLLKRYRPSHVFHLAASSTARHDALFENHEAISTGTLNVLEGVRLHCADARVFLTGSGLQFRNAGQPLDETSPFSAGSPYALARIHSTYAARYYREAFGTRAFVGYLFHHDSPRRSERHISQAIVAAGLRIAQGSPEKLIIGCPDVRKEFNFAGDVVAAMWTLVQQDSIHEAVIGSGRAHSLMEWAELCFSALGLDLREHLQPAAGFVPEYKVLVSNPAIIHGLGWRPAVGFDGLARMMLGQS